MAASLPRLVRISCAQVAPIIADPAANRALATVAIQKALAASAQIILLPELMTTGYHLRTQEAEVLAESAGGPSLTAWAEALAGSEAIVVGGFCERGNNGRIFNSAGMISAQGVMAVYRKTHLWGEEPLLFAPGSEPPPVIQTKWGPIGMAICYDLFFPELTRGLALEGAHLLALPTNSPWPCPREEGSMGPQDGIGHTVARAAAYLNRVFVAVCDRHGDERGNAWASRSSIIGPEGGFLAGPVGYADALLVADCDLDDARCKQWDGTTNDALGDRRPELYRSVVVQHPHSERRR
jgi:5-aminopentanamidase